MKIRTSLTSLLWFHISFYTSLIVSEYVCLKIKINKLVSWLYYMNFNFSSFLFILHLNFHSLRGELTSFFSSEQRHTESKQSYVMDTMPCRYIRNYRRLVNYWILKCSHHVSFLFKGLIMVWNYFTIFET